MATFTAIQCVLILFLLWLIQFLLHYFFKRPTKGAAHLRLPPTPPSLPIIGHLHHLNPVAYKGFHALSKYGPLLHLRLATYPVVLVSSASMVTEIFKTHDVDFAARIKSPFEDSLLFGSSTSFFNAPYGDYWKFMKKLCMTELLGASQIKRSRHVRREELLRFLTKVLEKSQKNEVLDLSAEVLTLTNNSTCRMIMSTRCSGEHNEAERCRELVTESFDLAAKLAFAKVFGPLRIIGIWLLRKQLSDIPRRYDEMFEKLLKEHEEKAIKEGVGREDKDLMDILLDVYHDKNAEVKITRAQMKTFCLDLFTGGTSTTADGILWIIGELINHPDAFKKLREEIESVVGDRLVEESDVPNLPYLQAVVKETQRLYPPVPLFDRVCRETVNIGGFDVPKGITMVMNAYSIMRDPNEWENPNGFYPERFLVPPKEEEGKKKNINFVPFGGGRRMCPGTNLSFSLTHGTVAAMVQCFDWKVDGGNGGKVNMDARPGVTMTLNQPLRCVAQPHFSPFIQA